MNRYMILDSEGVPTARGSSNDNYNAEVWKIKLDNPDLADLLSNKYVTLVGTSKELAGLEGHVLRIENGIVYIEPIRRINEEVRRNLRIPVKFSSYLYPVTGDWKGRIPIISHDLSCGGIAFYTQYSLEIGEIAEIVLPVTTNPLLLHLKILRKNEEASHSYFYAASFVDIIHDEEILVREAVFNLQIQRKRIS